MNRPPPTQDNTRSVAAVVEFPTRISPECEGAIELMRTYGRLNRTDQGRLLAIAKVLAATS